MDSFVEQYEAKFLADREAALKLVIAEIQNAFRKVSREGGVTLHETNVIDGHGSDRERAKARRMDTDETWPEVPSKDIEGHNAALCFLDPDGFRYYLPAFMSWSLTNYLTSASMSSDATIYALDVGNKRNLQEWKMERFALFDDPQSRAIARYLEFMVNFGCGHADQIIAGQALEKYWKTFL